MANELAIDPQLSPLVSTILTIAKSVVMGLAFWLLWTIRSVFTVGWNIHKFVRRFEKMVEDFTKAQADIQGIGGRLDKGGQRMSDLCDEVQGLPHVLEDKFITRREYEAANSDRDRYRREIREEMTRLWDAIDRKRR